MYEKIYYSDSFFQMFVQSKFTYSDFLQHKNTTINIYNQYLNKEIQRYPYGFWDDIRGLINTRLILDYLIAGNKITIKEILKSNKQIFIEYKIHYKFDDMSNRELIETLYPDQFHKEKPKEKSISQKKKVKNTTNNTDTKKNSNKKSQTESKGKPKSSEYENSIEFKGVSRRIVYYYSFDGKKMINIHGGSGEVYSQISFYGEEVDRLIEMLIKSNNGDNDENS